jgi:hypothetical protein
MWRARLQDLPRVAELGRVQGLAALDAGKFDLAQQLLSDAKRAVDTLGDDYDGADEIRQGAAEAAIFTTLVSDPLETILTEASADPKEWKSRFSTFYKGKSIIVDTHVAAAPNASGTGGRYDLVYRVLPLGEGDKPNRVGRLDLDGFKLFEQPRRDVGERVVFGARLASWSLDLETGEWRIGLEPDSGVYLRHPRALEAIGWKGESEPSSEDSP